MICPKCGTENDDNAIFCRKCGSELHLKEYYENNNTNINPIHQKTQKEPKQSKFKKNKILIVAIIAIIIVVGCIGGYLLMQPHYKEINVVGVTMEVPDSDCNVSIGSKSTSTYLDAENKVFVYGYDSNETGLSKIGGTIAFAMVKAAMTDNSKSINVDGITINESTSGTLSYCTYLGNKNIFIISMDKNIMVHIIHSLKESSESNNISNSSNLSLT